MAHTAGEQDPAHDSNHSPARHRNGRGREQRSPKKHSRPRHNQQQRSPDGRGQQPRSQKQRGRRGGRRGSRSTRSSRHSQERHSRERRADHRSGHGGGGGTSRSNKYRNDYRPGGGRVRGGRPTMTPTTAQLDRLSRHLRELEKIEDRVHRPRSDLRAPHNSPDSARRVSTAKAEQQGAGPARPATSPAKAEPSWLRRTSGKLAVGAAGLAALAVAPWAAPAIMTAVGTGTVGAVATAAAGHLVGSAIKKGAELVRSAVTGPSAAEIEKAAAEKAAAEKAAPAASKRTGLLGWNTGWGLGGGGVSRRRARTAQGALRRRKTRAARPPAAKPPAAKDPAVGGSRAFGAHVRKGARGVSGGAEKPPVAKRTRHNTSVSSVARRGIAPLRPRKPAGAKGTGHY